MRKERCQEPDILRAIAAVAVILIHITAQPLVTATPGSHWFWAAAFLNQSARFAVPAFVLISGLALGFTYRDRPIAAPLMFWWTRLRSIGLPYLVWSLIYLLYAAWMDHDRSLLHPGTILRALAEGNAMYHLYYILIALQLYLVFPLLRPWLTSRRLVWLVAAALLLQLGLLMLSTSGHSVDIPWLPSGHRWLPWWGGYYALGLWLGSNWARVRGWLERHRWPLAGAATGLLVVMMLDFTRLLARPGYNLGVATSGFRPSAYLFALAACLTVLAFAPRLDATPRLQWALRRLGAYSFGIYLVHPLFLSLATSLSPHLHLPPGPYLALVLGGVLAGAWALSWLLARLPGGAWLVGVRP